MERFAGFPFSIGCASRSSVKVVETQPKKSQAESSSSLAVQSSGKTKSAFGGLIPLPKTNISAGIQKVVKSFRNLSYLFHIYEEDDEDEDEEKDMEIGLPTDVQHVAHIGWNGFNGESTAVKSWDRGPDLLALPTISIRQFELAMAEQTEASSHQSNGPI